MSPLAAPAPARDDAHAVDGPLTGENPTWVAADGSEAEAAYVVLCAAGGALAGTARGEPAVGGVWRLAERSRLRRSTGGAAEVRGVGGVAGMGASIDVDVDVDVVDELLVLLLVRRAAGVCAWVWACAKGCREGVNGGSGSSDGGGHDPKPA